MSSNPPNGDERSATPVSAESFGSALSDPLRRTVLFHLKTEGTASFEELVEVAIATDPSRTGTGDSNWQRAGDSHETRTAVEKALFHLHLPKLELLGLVDWTPETRRVELRADLERLTEWLDVSFAESVYGAIGANDDPAPTPAPDISMLFVEDHASLRTVVVEQFDANHPEIGVTTAANAESALRALESTTFDCIVSDYDMPGSNGVDFLKAIRRVDDAVPFVIYTGKGTDETRTEATEHGANAYLQKRGGVGQFDLLADCIRQVVAERRENASAGA